MFRRKTKNDETPVIIINGKQEKDLAGPPQIPRLEPLKMSIVDENLTQKNISSLATTQRNGTSSRIKLRDYLFLTQTSAAKNISEKRKTLEHLSNDPNKIQAQKEKTHKKQSSSFVKKNKYGIKNREMFQILRKEIQTQLKDRMEQISTFSSDFKNQTKGSVIPSNAQMMMMYNLRTMLKEKMKGCIKQMKEALKHETAQINEGVQFQIQLDEQELGKDIAFTQEMFNKKYMEWQHKQLKK